MIRMPASETQRREIAGRYELLGQALSSGGMGHVYRARHRELDRTFAIKVVQDGLRQDPQLRELFFKEARLCSSLSHPNIISVTDFGFDEKVGYFLVMELLEGETVRERMHRGGIAPRIAYDLLDQVAVAVRYAHGRGIIHCDLKPENVFLTQVEGDRRRNLVKLLDFGLSFRTDHTEFAHGGTPPYVAPERYSREPPSPQTDVYALGMLLYELLAGGLPYKGALVDMMHQQLDGPDPPPPSRFAKDLDPRADELVMRAIARDPKVRHQNAEGFHFELRTLMNMQGIRLRPQAATGTSLPSGLVQSPIPFAIFEPSGALRFANQSFLKACAGSSRAPVQSFAELAICKLGPDIAGAHARVMKKERPVYRKLKPQVAGSAESILVLAPEVKAGRVAGVHATLVSFPKKSS
jgi:serine/threonine-protein kinase